MSEELEKEIQCKKCGNPLYESEAQYPISGFWEGEPLCRECFWDVICYWDQNEEKEE